MSCPNGIEINSEPTVDGTTFFIERESKPDGTMYMLITIKNTSNVNILIFRRHLFLWDTGVFRLVRSSNRNYSVPLNRHIDPSKYTYRRLYCVNIKQSFYCLFSFVFKMINLQINKHISKP